MVLGEARLRRDDVPGAEESARAALRVDPQKPEVRGGSSMCATITIVAPA